VPEAVPPAHIPGTPRASSELGHDQNAELAGDELPEPHRHAPRWFRTDRGSQLGQPDRGGRRLVVDDVVDTRRRIYERRDGRPCRIVHVDERPDGSTRPPRPESGAAGPPSRTDRPRQTMSPARRTCRSAGRCLPALARRAPHPRGGGSRSGHCASAAAGRGRVRPPPSSWVRPHERRSSRRSFAPRSGAHRRRGQRRAECRCPPSGVGSSVPRRAQNAEGSCRATRRWSARVPLPRAQLRPRPRGPCPGQARPRPPPRPPTT
jgi:hypothetical protein